MSNRHCLITCNDVMQHPAKRIVLVTRLQTIVQTATGQFPTFAIGQTMSGQLQDASGQSQPPFSLTLTAVPLKPIDASRQRAIISVSPSKNVRMEPRMNSVDQELSSSAVSAVEVRRLLEENARLRSLLIAHRIPIPDAAPPTSHPPQVSNSAPEARKPGTATAEQRIALFRSLFRGREDI